MRSKKKVAVDIDIKGPRPCVDLVQHLASHTLYMYVSTHVKKTCLWCSQIPKRVEHRHPTATVSALNSSSRVERGSKVRGLYIFKYDWGPFRTFPMLLNASCKSQHY